VIHFEAHNIPRKYESYIKIDTVLSFVELSFTCYPLSLFQPSVGPKTDGAAFCIYCFACSEQS